MWEGINCIGLNFCWCSQHWLIVATTCALCMGSYQYCLLGQWVISVQHMLFVVAGVSICCLLLLGLLSWKLQQGMMHCTAGSHYSPVRINWHNQRSGNQKSSQPTIMAVCSVRHWHTHIKFWELKFSNFWSEKSTARCNITGELTIWIFVSYRQSLPGEQNLLNFVSVETLWVLSYNIPFSLT